MFGQLSPYGYGMLSPGYTPYTMGMNGMNLGGFNWASPTLGYGIPGNPYQMTPQGITGGPEMWRNPYQEGPRGYVHPGNPVPQQAPFAPLSGGALAPPPAPAAPAYPPGWHPDDQFGYGGFG